MATTCACYLPGTKSAIECADGSPVRSPANDDPNVYAVCHHSGQYLTRTEVNPRHLFVWDTPNEFPGLPQLNREFGRAAHAAEQQHAEWHPSLMIVTAVLYAGILLILIWLLIGRLDTVGSTVGFVVHYTLISLGTIVTVMMLAWSGRATWRLATSQMQHVATLPPAISDFPLLCRYVITAHEQLRVDLGNQRMPSPEQTVAQRTGGLTVELFSRDTTLKHYQDYRRSYRNYQLSNHFYAGMLALENRKAVQFQGTPLEYDHRLRLRQPIPTALARGTLKSDTESLARFELPYTIELRSLYPGKPDERWRFPLECEPQLNATNSRTLELRFRWNGSPDLVCTLEVCQLTLPEGLQVENVRLGRDDSSQQQIVWRKLELPKQQDLILSVTFTQPMLHYHDVLHGSYRCTVNGLVSGLQVRDDRLWDARGMKALTEAAPTIKRSTVIEGALNVHVGRLQQEQEHSRGEHIFYLAAPNHKLVAKVVEVLLAQQVDLLRIEQATPRLDLQNNLHARLYYWDILGHYYVAELLDTIEVHVIIAGSGSGNLPAMNGNEAPPEPSRIEVYTRCRHDPRNAITPWHAERLLESIRNGLAHR